MINYAIDFETANNYQNSACSVGVVRFVDGMEDDSLPRFAIVGKPNIRIALVPLVW